MAARETTPNRSLWALLSQTLVAFTVELDNEFERRMSDAGYPGALLSLTVWASLMRFVGESGITVRNLMTSASAPEERIRLQLGCLERWRFIELDPKPTSGRREGWGSGRGIRGDWSVRLTARGLAASMIWPPLFGAIERRWEKRFGAEEIARLREALRDIADSIDVEPHGDLPLPSLLWRLLSAFRNEFDRESPAPLELCANTLRVLSEEPVREADIPRLTGCSPETGGIGWQIKPYITVGPDPAAKRGRVVSLSPLGLAAAASVRSADRGDRQTLGSPVWRGEDRTPPRVFAGAVRSARRRRAASVGGTGPRAWNRAGGPCGACVGTSGYRGRGAEAGARSGGSDTGIRERSRRVAASLSAVGHEPGLRPLKSFAV